MAKFKVADPVAYVTFGARLSNPKDGYGIWTTGPISIDDAPLQVNGVQNIIYNKQGDYVYYTGNTPLGVGGAPVVQVVNVNPGVSGLVPGDLVVMILRGLQNYGGAGGDPNYSKSSEWYGLPSGLDKQWVYVALKVVPMEPVVVAPPPVVVQPTGGTATQPPVVSNPGPYYYPGPMYPMPPAPQLDLTTLLVLADRQDARRAAEGERLYTRQLDAYRLDAQSERAARADELAYELQLRRLEIEQARQTDLMSPRDRANYLELQQQQALDPYYFSDEQDLF